MKGFQKVHVTIFAVSCAYIPKNRNRKTRSVLQYQSVNRKFATGFEEHNHQKIAEYLSQFFGADVILNRSADAP